MESVLQEVKECYVCNTTYNLHDHHIIYGTANRKQSEKYGLKVWLCMYHHTGSNEAVHNNRELDLKLKRIAQEYYEAHYGTRKSFIEIFGKSYL